MRANYLQPARADMQLQAFQRTEHRGVVGGFAEAPMHAETYCHKTDVTDNSSAVEVITAVIT